MKFKWKPIVLSLILSAVTAITLAGCSTTADNLSSQQPVVSTTSQESTLSQNDIVERATIASVGDILLHASFLGDGNDDMIVDSPIHSAYYDTKSKGYDFSPIFQKVAPYYARADYTLANLEVTLCGDDKIGYSGYPVFNSPDTIVDALKNSGVDMLLTANNHITDTNSFGGFDRTQNAIASRGLAYAGTTQTNQEKKYDVVEMNGIKIGIVNYVYASYNENGQLCNNGIPLTGSLAGRVNTFTYEDLEKLYRELKSIQKEMANESVDATIFYPHWGEEYQLTANENQKKIAKQVAELGFDAIVGNHPHVVQPVEVIATKGGRKVPVLYSMGNQISNQRKELMDNLKDGHTEDGLIYYLNFVKYENGQVTLESIDAVPTWVYLYRSEDGKKTYEILPLIQEVSSSQPLPKDSNAYQQAQASYKRTMSLVQDGIATYNQAVQQDKA